MSPSHPAYRPPRTARTEKKPPSFTACATVPVLKSMCSACVGGNSEPATTFVELVADQ